MKATKPISCLIFSFWAITNVFNVFAGEPGKQNYECTYNSNKVTSEQLSLEFRDGKIFRFDYASTHQPNASGPAYSCSVGSFRAGRESEWQDKGNITTAPHLVGKGGNAGQAIMEDQPEKVKIRFVNLDPLYYCETAGVLADEIVLSKNNKQCLSVRSTEYTNRNKKD